MKEAKKAKGSMKIDEMQLLTEIETFEETLVALYMWKHHHQTLQDILIPAITKKSDNDLLDQLVSPNDGDDDCEDGDPYGSPNTFFTLLRKRKHSRALEHGDSY